jgi:hypothetical protein
MMLVKTVYGGRCIRFIHMVGETMVDVFVVVVVYRYSIEKIK